MEVKPFGDPDEFDDDLEPVAEPAPPAPTTPVPPDAPEPPAQPAAEPPPTTSVIQAISRRNWTRGLIWFGVGLVVLTALGFAAATIGEMIAR